MRIANFDCKYRGAGFDRASCFNVFDTSLMRSTQTFKVIMWDSFYELLERSKVDKINELEQHLVSVFWARFVLFSTYTTPIDSLSVSLSSLLC